MKVLKGGVLAEGKAVARFVNEARIAGKLHHPNIVPVHGIGMENGVPFFAMEFIEGETLVQILERPADLTPPDAYRWARAFGGAAEGLQHAHERGVIHRDLKPSNLILDRSSHENGGRLRILDFGLARLEGQESLTASGEFLGTPLYMSPEQARTRKATIDRRTDIYSTGFTS